MNQTALNQSAQTQEIIGEKVLIQAFETLQLGSKQDYCAQGSYVNRDEKNVYWSVAFDGHGRNDTISIIRSCNLHEIMENDNPEVEIQKRIDDVMKHNISSRENYRSGATMVLGKATFCETYTEIVITNIGDSSGVLYINGEPVFITKEHNYENGEEMVRLISEGRLDKKSPILKSSRAINVYSRDKLYSKSGYYVNFVLPSGETMELSPSQSLGHLGICGFKPTVTVFRILPTDDFKIVLCSDGVTDVMPVNGVGSPIWLKFMAKSSAKEIVDIAQTQWMREWGVAQERSEYNDFIGMPKVSFPTRGGYDDCCCAVMEFRKAVLTEWRLLDNGAYIKNTCFQSAELIRAVSVAADEFAATKREKEDDEDDLYN